jgi:hypothetical protein
VGVEVVSLVIALDCFWLRKLEECHSFWIEALPMKPSAIYKKSSVV